ncbi:MAG: bifunctional 3,4-dihydroxy-2-butanone 4-phosphate synthase/GTP cyclohydrolase II [Candidatus Melainabacteria bacterium GWF2_37_15]|nr:MAG: bifunctional 3,4-dihydroxy-2-butanone 4-phosphate synthase/GTP cyclohydrolase II [Candidatus Melainabacteria bacterium GWF2_37_15]
MNTVEEAIQDIKDGKMVIVADNEDRENEGDLVCAAEKITPEIINFMIKEARGLICVPLTSERAKELNLNQMVHENTESHGTAFTVSVDASAIFGVTTGISAHDRAMTIKVLVDANSRPSDLRRPGHIFPLEAKKGGVLNRVGQTEASVDLARLAGLYPAGVICEIIKEDGTMARRDDLVKFAKKHDLKFITVAQLIKYRLRKERFVKRVIKAQLPTAFGDFDIYGYLNLLDNSEHVALVKGDPEEFSNDTPLVRMHSECLTGDIFHSLRCDCGDQLCNALEFIQKEGKGALVYIKTHEGRGIGILNKLKAYVLQEQGQDTVEANLSLGFEPDLRDYGVGAQILLDLGIKKFRLITNNPKKIIGLEGYDLEIVDRVELPVCKNKHNEKYLNTKRDKMEHLMD